MSNILKKIEGRKSLHFNITADSHAAVRIACFKHKITMQEFFEEISALVFSENPAINSIMKDVSERKKSRQVEKLSKTDEESLYNIIENEING
jgi:hypothetical protein